MELGKKLLFIRVDRIGDLVLTLPVDEVAQLNGLNITWWITKGLEFVVESRPKTHPYQAISSTFTWAQFFFLWKWLRIEKFDLAIVFYGPWWISFVLWLAGVPVRAGRKSQWHSYLFLNKGFRQSRSRSEVHESEYNFLLLEKVIATEISQRPFLKLEEKNAEHITERYHLKKKHYVVVHPGMAGSARNVSTNFYLSLIKMLVEHYDLVVTGTKADLPYIEPIKSKLGNHPRIFWLNEKLNGYELISVLQNALAVIAPSTGVIHLAASVGTKAIGLYSPVLSQHAKRWSPRGSQTEVFAPQVDCPGTASCLFSACPKFDCMEMIKPEDIAARISIV